MSIWARQVNQLALLELVSTGALRRRKRDAAAWDTLESVPWTRASGRRDELLLVPERRGDVEILLDRVFPTWRAVERALKTEDLAVGFAGWRTLRERRRATRLGGVDAAQLNKRTVSAAVGAHSKTGHADRYAELLDVELTGDGAVRLRPNPGLTIRRGAATLDAAAIATVLGDVFISDRAFRDGLELTGRRPRAVLLVENLGAYMDLVVPADWLVAFVPGWDITMVLALLAQLADLRAFHFGDLDPNGIQIYRRLKRERPDLTLVAPPFWSEYVELHAQPKTWPDLDLAGLPTLVATLHQKGLWLEQEPLVLDPRLPAHVSALL